MENFNYITKKETILFFVQNGYSILELETSPGQSVFFIANQFEPPIQGSVHSAPYLSVTGKDITKFIKDNTFNQGNPTQFKDKIDQFNSKERDLEFKFSDNHVWRHYTS